MRNTLSVLAMLAAAQFCLAQDAKFDLSKRPVFRPGDVMTSTATTENKMEMVAGGKIVRAERTVKQSVKSIEVLAVDASGAPTEVRVTIQSAVQDETGVLPSGESEKKKTSLQNLVLTAKRDGNQIVWDTSAVLAKDANSLTASQIALLKDIAKPSRDFDGFPLRDIELMSRKPVSVGDTWELSADVLKKYAEGILHGKGESMRFRGAMFRLTSASGKVASVEGNMAVTFSVAGVDVDGEARLACRIDTQTGRWLESNMAGSFAVKRGEATFKVVSSQGETLRFTPGAGKASPAPDWRNKLGWAKPGPDTNSYKNTEVGVSLDVPKSFKPVEVPKQGALKAKFQDENARAFITLTQDMTPVYVDIDELLPGVIESIKGSLEGYKVTKQTPLTLPGNIPALILIATAMEGKLNLVTIMAVDGKKVFSASLGAPSDSAVTVEKLTDIAKTLRVIDAEK